jgi:hypothetical protein
VKGQLLDARNGIRYERHLNGLLHTQTTHAYGDRRLKDRKVNLPGIRSALQGLSRGQLLIIAERAVAVAPSTELNALVGEFVQVPVLTEVDADVPTLRDEIGNFYVRSMSGEYYESFPISGWNCTQQSMGTDAFIAEFDRLVGKCVDEVGTVPGREVLESFEILFGLLRHIDTGQDDVIFFADEGGSWDVGVHWRTVLPAYFRCLTKSAGAEEFAREVDRAITDFANHDREHYLSEAWRVAAPPRKASLEGLTNRSMSDPPRD